MKIVSSYGERYPTLFSIYINIMNESSLKLNPKTKFSITNHCSRAV
jgi:hypothetical protein